MKANVPEKIYMSPAGVLYKGDKQQCNDIEYTRTDAFIENAEEYLYKQLNEGNMECGDIETFIKDFRNYMEGE